MTVKVKKITYLIPPRDILNEALDVFVYLEDDSFYLVEVTTPQFLSIMMEKGKRGFLSTNYPYIIVSKLTDDIIRVAIESFINSDDDDNDELYWLKLYHVIPTLTLQQIDEILYRKEQEEIELEAEFEAESDTKD